MYQRILVPTDGSEISTKAVSSACSMAKLTGASVVLLSVKLPFPYSMISEMQPVAPQAYFDAQSRQAAEWLSAARNIATQHGVAAEALAIEAEQPWEAIVEQAKAKHCDLIVMASHGRRGIAALLLGSETTRVLTHSPLPVLVVR